MKLLFENTFPGNPEELKYTKEVVYANDENYAYKSALVDAFQKDVKTLLDILVEFDEKWDTVDGIRAYCSVLNEPYQAEFMSIMYRFMDELKKNIDYNV